MLGDNSNLGFDSASHAKYQMGDSDVRENFDSDVKRLLDNHVEIESVSDN